MNSLFYQLTANMQPYIYQSKCAKAIQARKNLIISAPTGAGKTWAALLGYLHSLKEGRPIADRVFYVLPMRTLANNLFDSTVTSCRNVFAVTTDVEEKRRHPDNLAITLQTGEKKGDPFFQGDIIFTTIDQLLSSYLNIPISLPAKLANINAGALIGSLVIFDEVHLLDPRRSLATVMEMATRLRFFTQLVFMTATLSTAGLSELKDDISAETIKVTENELTQMQSHKDKQRRYVWVDKPLTAEYVLEKHNGGRSIVICNSVARAQGIYKQIKQLASPTTKLFLLHSRFYKKDRQNIEGQLAEYFGPYAKHENAILVTTQVVEVGIDISAEHLHTELCPANSLIQRAGRCARYPVPRNIGTVWVYELEQTEHGKYRLGPYIEAAKTIEATRQAVSQISGQILGFFAEQRLLDEVHEKEETEIFREIMSQRTQRRKIIDTVINNSDRSRAAELIRSIQSLNVVVTETPENIDMTYLPELLSIPRMTIHGIKELVERSDEQNWAVKIPQVTGENDAIEWKVVKKIEELAGAGWLVALSPNIASYTPEIGLELGVVGSNIALECAEKVPWIVYKYDYELFSKHVTNVVNEVRLGKEKYRMGTKLLAENLDIPNSLIEHLAELCGALHDSGKLLNKWQNAAQRWQQDIYPEHITNFGYPIAHMTYRQENGDRYKQQAKVYERGLHAAGGAFGISQEVCFHLEKYFSEEIKLEKAVKAVLTAIMRHHDVKIDKMKQINFIPNAASWLNQALSECMLGVIKVNSLLESNQIGDFDELTDFIIDAENDGTYLLLYWMLVRRLRLADQASLK